MLRRGGRARRGANLPFREGQDSPSRPDRKARRNPQPAAGSSPARLVAPLYCAARDRFISRNFVQVVPSVDISPISLQRSATVQSMT